MSKGGVERCLATFSSPKEDLLGDWRVSPTTSIFIMGRVRKNYAQ